MMLSRRTLLKLVAAGAVPAFALCGCAHPQMIDLGSTESPVSYTHLTLPTNSRV